MSEKANIGRRGKQGIVYGFYKHTIYSSPAQKNKSSYSPRTVPKINSVGYNRNKIIFALTSQNYSKGLLTPQKAHAPTLFISLNVIFAQLFVISQITSQAKLQKFIVTKNFRKATQFLPQKCF